MNMCVKTPIIPAALTFLLATAASATTYTLNPGDDLQAAVNRAVGGDEIVLPPSFTFQGILTLPVRQENGWVVVRTSQVASLPSGQRVGPSQANLMPKLTVRSSDPVIQNNWTTGDHSQRPAHHYRFIGLELTTTSTINWNIVYLDPGTNPTPADLPHDIQFERCYIHGNLAGGEMIRGVMASAYNFVLQDSHVSDFQSTFVEANAFSTVTSPGPFWLLNNYLEAAGENVMFEGIAGLIPNMIPSNIVIFRNYFTKKLSWRGSPYIVKNHLEFKAGKNIMIDSNVLEYCWYAAQNGPSIVMIPRTFSGVQPNNTIQNAVVTNNIIRHVARAITVGDHDDLSGLPNSALNYAKSFVFRNNLMQDLSSVEWGTRAIGFELGGPPASMTIDKNTIQFAESCPPCADPVEDAGWWNEGIPGPSNMVVTNNSFGWQLYGDGRGGPDAIVPGTTFTHNQVLNVIPSEQGAWQQQSPGTVLVPAAGYGADMTTLMGQETKVKTGQW